MQYEKTGQLTIRPICAVFVDEVEKSGRQNPYCEVLIGNSRLITGIASNQPADPAWVDRIDYQLTGEESLELFAYDSDFRTKGDYNGNCRIQLANVFTQRNLIEFYDIFRDGKRTGRVKVAFNFVPDRTPDINPKFQTSSVIQGGLIYSQVAGVFNTTNTI